MKKSLILILSIMLLISFVFAACASKDNGDADNSSDTEVNLEDYDSEFGFETEDVTDENGKAVTDSDGNKVTTDVAVIYKKDSKGNTYAQKLDADGEGVTDKKGNAVTVKSKTTTKASNKDTTTTAKSNNNSNSRETTTTTSATKPTVTEKPTATTKKGVELTKDQYTTEFDGKEVVPKTDATGKEVNFDEKDMEIIANMLEVPYLYKEDYENSDPIPIDTAVYTAVWMAQNIDGASATGDDTKYNSNQIILNLFKYYGNTVVNFKTQCNSVKGTPIKYLSDKDCFKINSFPEKQQDVTITKIEDLGNNNFYKITGTVSNVKGVDSVVAIIQKNRLETKLGFSIKALKWS